jgi:hypothetical protein
MLQPGANFATTTFISQASSSATYNLVAIHFPVARTVTTMTVKLVTAPGGPTTRTFTLYKNGATTGFAVTIAGVNTTGSVSGSISYAQFDTFSVLATLSGPAAASSGSIVLTYI